jgi:hypothetical protein
MTDLAHDEDGSQIEREIAIAEAHLARVKWFEVLQGGLWQDWPEDIQVRFLSQVPPIRPDELQRFNC